MQMKAFNKGLIARLKRLSKNDSGQGMTEYIIIVALIAIMSIGFVSAFGDNIRGLFAASATALAGKENLDTKKFVKEIDGGDKSHRGLKDFNKYETP